MVHIELVTALSFSQAVFDDFTSEFEDIVTLSQMLLKTNWIHQSATICFTFDLGIILPLWLVGIKCRVKSIRRQSGSWKLRRSKIKVTLFRFGQGHTEYCGLSIWDSEQCIWYVSTRDMSGLMNLLQGRSTSQGGSLKRRRTGCLGRTPPLGNGEGSKGKGQPTEEGNGSNAELQGKVLDLVATLGKGGVTLGSNDED
ncbi:hypothetical protein VE04_09850 [Pseudogymnoascus sp. 24MN13]|nr:hypothetical protein VE04_09850 [Pseudogymnoascus sp. 24MN13]